MADDPLSLDSGELTVWVLEQNHGKPDAADAICRKVVARVETLTRTRFRRFSRVGRFVDVEDVVQNTMIRLLNACRMVRPTSRRHFYALTRELIRRELLDLTKHYFGPFGHGTNLSKVAVGEGER
jgi:DNA-directed RNA polymerase specialized sigma subunit